MGDESGKSNKRATPGKRVSGTTSGGDGKRKRDDRSAVPKPPFDEVLQFAEGADDAGKSGALPLTPPSPPRAAALMPTGPAADSVLRDRAAQLAAVRSAAEAETAAGQYLRVRIGQAERYGIDYQYLEEITYPTHLARVPCTPKFVAGVINRRGELVSVLDIKPLFDTTPAESVGEQRIVIVRAAGKRFGILVDEVEGNDDYRRESLAPAIPGRIANQAYVDGIYDGKITMLNLETMGQDPVLEVNESVS